MNPSIVQLRGTVFMPVSIGYNEENEKKFKDLLPEGRVLPIIPMSQETIIRGGMRLGEPWQLVKNGRSISFNYARVDIVEIRTDNQIATELEFVKYCTETFSKLLKEVGYFTRLAYSPTFAMDEIGDFKCKNWWNTIFVNTNRAGYAMHDINLSYYLTKEIQLRDKSITLNLHHKIFDGYRYDDKQVKVNDSIIITLDLNTAEIDNVMLRESDIFSFFEEVLDEKISLMKMYFGV